MRIRDQISESAAIAAKRMVVMSIGIFYMSGVAKCYNSLCLFRKTSFMTTLTVGAKEALHSSNKIPPDRRYWMYKHSSIFPRIAPPALMGDYPGSWSTFIQEMQASEKCGVILQKLVDISNLCILLAIPPSVFFYMMDEEIRDSVKTFYGKEKWERVKNNFSEDFFKTLSAGMMARIQYWETRK